MKDTKILIAEAIGTMILVLGGPGTAILAAGTGTLDGAAVLGIALAFGFSLLVAAYTIGPISGCHINPAVTLGMAAMKKIETAKVPAYIVGQLLGAATGALIIWIIAQGMPGGFDAAPGTFAANLWGEGDGYSFFNFGAMALSEIVMTAVLMFAVLSTTSEKFTAAAGGLTVGITLVIIHLISIPVDNTSVNPARSFATALFAGGDAIEQLWAFVVFPIIGAMVGVLVYIAVDDSTLEDSMLGDR